MSERIDNTSEPPSVVVSDRHYLFCSRGYGAGKDGVRIGNDQDHPGGTAIEGLGAEVMMLWRFIRQPELCPVDRKRCYDRTGVFEKKNFLCSECRLVEFECSFAISDRQHRLDLSFDVISTHSSSRDKRYLVSIETSLRNAQENSF